jgi:uncharacterized protein (TIGR03435 family)
MNHATAAIVFVAMAGSAALYAQSVDVRPAFEVASVKPATSGRGVATVVRGGPGSTDPGLATLENIDLFSLVTMAYGVRRYEVSAPEWLGGTRFSITARVPQDATAEQYRQMLQRLLAERFQLSLHHERKELQIYDLVVGKNGPKLKESADAPAPSTNDGLQPPPQRAGPPPGYHGPVNMSLPKVSMERFAALLSGLLDAPITDSTALHGVYDIQFRALVGSNPPAESADPPPSILDAVQEQLGLKLVPKKELTDILVIDHMERVPTEN